MAAAAKNKTRKNPPLTRAEVKRYENVGLTPTLDLNDLAFRWVYRDAKDFDVSGAISAMNLERTIEGASVLTVTLKDPNGRLFSDSLKHSMRLPRGPMAKVARDEGWDPILKPNDAGLAMEVRLDGARFRLVKASASYATGEVTLTFEDLIVHLLKRKKNPPLSSSRKAMTRAMFVQRLVREIQYIRPPFVCPDLYVVQPIDKTPANDDTGGGSTPTRNADKAGNAINRRYPAHSLGASGVTRLTKDQVRDAAAAGGFRGREITGMEQIAHGESDYYPGVVSSDQGHGLWQMTPRVWGATAVAKMNALGGLAEMRNPTQNAKMAKYLYDEAGHTFKPWHGTKYLTVSPGPGAGAGDAGDSSDPDTSSDTTTRTTRASYQFERKRGESSWAAIQRLASEVNWRAFVVGEAFHYESEPALFRHRIRYELTPEALGVLDLTYDVDWGKPVSDATLTVALARWDAPPGSVVMLKGFGPPDGRWLIVSVRRDWFSPVAEVTLKQPGRQLSEPDAQTRTETSGSSGDSYQGDPGKVTTDGGAKGIVEQAFAIAQDAGGEGVYVASDYRANSTTTSGNVSDHSRNDSTQAARDIAVRGIDALVGPPSPKLDRAVVAIGKAFGREYGSGTSGAFQNADNIMFNGYRVQIIWRTPQWGGHMGHIHVGARKS